LNKKLHILFLCGWYPSKEFPTNGDFIQRHAEAVSLKHKVSVLHIVSSNSINNSKIEKNSITNVDTYIGYVTKTTNPVLKLVRFYKMYITILKEIGCFDVVHLNSLFPFGIFALHLKAFKKKPYIISEHWTGYHFPLSKKISFIEKLVSKSIAKKASFISPVSTHLQISMQKFGLKGNYCPIPNVVDIDLFKPQTKKEKQFSILHISSLKNEHKNISGMLKAAKILEAEIPSFTWDFIGGNGNQYKDEIKNLGFTSANINFIDHLPQEKLVSYLQKAHVFILFSNYENLPCVILESFSCGTPVISTNVGGIAEYFPEGFGTFTSVNNPSELAQKIKKINDNPINKPEDMYKYAKENFSKEIIAKQFSEVYFKTLNINS